MLRANKTRDCDLIVLGVLALAFALRFFRLGEVPSFYPDECHYIEFGHNLVRGRFAWGLFSHSYLPRLPLPLALMGLSTLVFGPTLVAVRAASALMGVLTAFMLYLLVRPLEKIPYRWLIPLTYTLLPPCVYFSRWGFTYNFLPPLFLAALLCGVGLDQAPTRRRVTVLALAAGAAMLVEPLGVIAFLYGTLCLFPRHRDFLGRYLLLSLAPLLLYLAGMYLALGEVLTGDIRSIFSERLSGDAGPAPSPLIVLLSTLWDAYGWLLGLGLAGLFLLPTRWRAHLTGFVLLELAVLIAVSGDDATLVLRESIVILPFMALGLAMVAIRTAQAVLPRAHRMLLEAGRRLTPELFFGEARLSLHRRVLPGVSRGLLFLALALILWLALLGPARGLIGGFRTSLDGLCLHETGAMREAVRFVRGRVGPGDLVLGDCLPELLPCRTATLMQMAVRAGARGNPFFPHEIFQDRLLDERSPAEVNYVILSPFTQRVEPLFPGVRELLAQYQTWPEVYRKDNVAVLGNPKIKQ